MIGQPTETSEDVAAIPDLAGRMLERLRVLDPTGKPFGKLTLSISSFVPKPWTPFQWAPFDGAESLSAKLETIKRGVRTFSNVRVSVTDRCNLRCGYCMPEEEYVWLPREEILHFEEVSRLVDVFIELGVDKVRLTGGEPLLRRGLPALIRLLAARPALRDLAITTNGVLLAEHAPALRAAGLHRVTVSLDTLRPERVAALTRRNHHAQVLEGIAA